VIEIRSRHQNRISHFLIAFAMQLSLNVVGLARNLIRAGSMPSPCCQAAEHDCYETRCFMKSLVKRQSGHYQIDHWTELLPFDFGMAHVTS
jgi:hypothetical protein